MCGGGVWVDFFLLLIDSMAEREPKRRRRQVANDDDDDAMPPVETKTPDPTPPTQPQQEYTFPPHSLFGVPDDDPDMAEIQRRYQARLAKPVEEVTGHILFKKKNKPKTENKTEPKTENENETEPKTENKNETEPKTENKNETEPKTEDKNETEPKTENKNEPEPENKYERLDPSWAELPPRALLARIDELLKPPARLIQVEGEPQMKRDMRLDFPSPHASLYKFLPALRDLRGKVRVCLIPRFRDFEAFARGCKAELERERVSHTTCDCHWCALSGEPHTHW